MMMRSFTMKVPVLALLLVNVRLVQSCVGEESILLCLKIPPAFLPGYSSVLMVLKDVGEINSTVLRSENLISVTRLRIEAAGITGIAEGAFSSFQNLRNLSLNQNLLTEMNPNWFGRPDILSELSLTGNQIEVLDEFMLNSLIGLTKLSLNKNRIRTIDPNSFRSQSVLAELDLSENRMTQVSPQVFKSLKSTRIRLHGNPWDCSCSAEDFVDFLKGLQSRSLLDRQLEVTCENPPSLRGRPVWNVSVCVTSPPPRPQPVTQTIHLKPIDFLTTGPLSTVMTTPPSRPTPETKTPIQPKTTDAPMIISSHTAMPPARPTSDTRTSIQPKPIDNLPKTTTHTPKTETDVTSPLSPPSVTETTVHPKPSYLTTYTSSIPTGLTGACVTSQPSSGTNTVCTIVIVFLSLLLFVVCFLVVLHRRKHSNKTVMPGGSKENRNESKEDGSRSSHAPSPGHSEEREHNHWDSEVGWRRSFTGVRAKSANAILSTSPFCAPVKDQVTLQTETEAQSKDTENQTEGEQKLESETEADGGFETDRTNTAAVNAGQAADGRKLDKDAHCVVANTDTVPYLSIGTNQNKPDDFNQQSTGGSDQRSLSRKVMGRISTWPPTAVQWQARCKRIEEQEESDVFSAWTPKFAGEVKWEVEHPFGEDQIEENQIKDPLKKYDARVKVGHSQSPNLTDKTPSFSEAHARTDVKQEEHLEKEEMIQDPETVTQTMSETSNLNQEKLGQTQDLKPADKNIIKSSNKTEQGNGSKQAMTSRHRAENRSTGSKAPSGGTSPDDETLLSGNEYAFMDLLHEVVQNNGRWTRERWRQTHANKQRR